MIDKNSICNMIPHSGQMCLLDEIINWDERRIFCKTTSHMLETNPLRNKEGLPMLSLIEYAAQAMAVHGCLLSQSQGLSMSEGYLAALKEVNFNEGLLSDVSEELVIEAEKIYAEAGNMIYSFSIHAGLQELASGRATVIGKFKESSI